METKKCTCCLVEKPVSEFTPDKSRPGTYISWCRTCISTSMRNLKRVRAEEPSKKCSSCSKPTGPIKGRVNLDDRVVWECEPCRKANTKAEKEYRLSNPCVLWGCDWCNKEAMVPEPLAKARRFCSLRCEDAWDEARKQRIADGVRYEALEKPPELRLIISPYFGKPMASSN